MKLSNEIKVDAGDDGHVVLREPTAREWNNYTAAKGQLRGQRYIDKTSQARGDLFDKIVMNIEGIEDDNGPITMETKDRIPLRLKSQIIFKAFEEEDAIDVKNS